MHQGPNMNPYAPPSPQMQGGGMPGGPPGSPQEAAARGLCPQCGSSDVHQPGFTWWGGVLGPKLFNHWVCRSCSFGYNRSTGLSNRGRIITYLVVVNGIVIFLFIMMSVAR